MKRNTLHRKQIIRFAAVILGIQLLALLVLTGPGLELIFPIFARVSAEKIQPETNTYAVYYDTRVKVSESNIIILGMDFGIAQSYDVFGHFTRFVKQYNNISSVLLELTIPQHTIISNLLTLDDESDYLKRIGILEEKTGLPKDYCDYISEVFYINRTVTPARRLNVISYAQSDNDIYSKKSVAVESKASRVMKAFNSSERNAVCAVDSSDLEYNSEFRRELDALAAESNLNIMYVQMMYSGSCAEGYGHRAYSFPQTGSDPVSYFVNNSRADTFYSYYSFIVGEDSELKTTKDRLDKRFTDYYFVITNGTQVKINTPDVTSFDETK